MANTFKLVTKAGVTTIDTIYTPNAVTTVILGLILGNTTSRQITATVTLNSSTSNRTNDNDDACPAAAAACCCLLMLVL